MPESLPEQGDPATSGLEVGGVELVYKLEGKPDELGVFELSQALEGLGRLIQAGNHVLNPQSDDVLVKVRPFKEGSFIMDLVLYVQQSPAILFVLTYPEAIAQIRKVLEYLGLIKRAKEIITTLVDIRFLKNGRPAKVEPGGDNTFSYYNQQGQVMPVTAPVHNLINNGTIQNFIFPALGLPLQHEGVDELITHLKQDQSTAVRIGKEDAEALRAFTAPQLPEPEEEVLENITIEYLHPKAGTYGETEGPWTFTRAGSKKNPIRGTITDTKFLSKFERGIIRFYRDDLLKVKLKQTQTVKGTKGRVTYEVIEVLEYKKAPPPKPTNYPR